MSQTALLTASDGAAGDQLGTIVGISGNTIVASAPLSSGPSGRQGAVYVFQRPQSGAWVDTDRFASKLTASDGQIDDYFGEAAAVGDNGSLIGAGTIRGCYTQQQGHAYVFVRPSTRGWPASMTQTAELTPSDRGSEGCFGDGIAVGEGLVVVGSPLNTTNTFEDGSAYTFSEPSTGWADMSAPSSMLGGSGSSLFGFGISIGGRTIAVGARNTTVNGITGAGAVYLFSN
jgi:hypothetical protein